MADCPSKCVDCGKVISFTAKRCRSCASKNNIGNYSRSEDHRLKMSGEGNPQWKGDKVSRGALHDWVKDHKPRPELCEDCKKKPPLDLANIDGKYARDLETWRWLCRSCHTKLDYNLGFRTRKVAPKDLKERITFLIKNGLKVKEIAIEIGVNKTMVYKYMPQEFKTIQKHDAHGRFCTIYGGALNE